MIKEVILQGGYVRCPICDNAFKWSYELKLITNSDFKKSNITSPATTSTPHNYITHTATIDGKVRFFIGCEKCGVTIETDAMELMNLDNYNLNKA